MHTYKTEKTLYTQKAKLFRELASLIWEGKELTFYWNIGMVNEKDNKMFLDTLELIQQNNYIKDINEKQFTRNNKIADKMTIDQIQKEINKYERIVSPYRNMHETTRKALAVGTMTKHYQKWITEYDLRIETKQEYYLMESIAKLKQKIKDIELQLVAA